MTETKSEQPKTETAQTDWGAVKVLKVKFEKPWRREYGRAKPIEAHDWEFSAETDQELPHGYSGFGGLLRKVQRQLPGQGHYWQAKAHPNGAYWGPACDRREDAVQAIVPQVAELFQQFAEEKERELEEEEKQQKQKYRERQQRERYAEMGPQFVTFLTNFIALMEDPRTTASMPHTVLAAKNLLRKATLEDENAQNQI